MSDPVLLIGGLGSIGLRYQAILKSINVPFIVYDYGSPLEDSPDYNGQKNIPNIQFDKAIICSPTETHINYVHQLIHLGKTFLCEKPLSKDMEDMESLPDYPAGFVVCNYKFLVKPYGMSPSIRYDYYKSGRDGLLWDCCQLIYLDPECELKNESPLWNLHVNCKEVPYRALELSYVQMIKSFIWNKGKDLWTLKDGVEMSKAVMNRQADEIVKIVREA